MSFRRILESAEKRVQDCFWHVGYHAPDGRFTRIHFRPVSRANEPTTLPWVRHKFAELGPMVYRLLFESSAELIRRTDTPTRLATDSAE
jgi:hypothetical protein